MLDLIQWRAGKTPEAKALFFNGRWYSFRDLEGRANRLANRLLSLGIQRGDRVSVLAHNHLVHFDLLLAAPKIGVVYAPFNPHLGDEALVAFAAAVKPSLLFADSRHHAIAGVLGVPWTRLSDYRDWLAVGSLDVPPVPELAVEDPYIYFATPNGVAVLPYRQVLLNARHAADAWGLSAQDSTVHCLPCFGPEINLLCLPLLYRGGRVVLMSNFDADEYLGHLALHRITVSALTPPMLRQITEYGDFQEADLSSIRWLTTVGTFVPQSVRQQLRQRGLDLRLLIPSAEAGPNLFNTAREGIQTQPERLGAPLPDLQVALHRPDGSTASQGEIGTLVLSGPMLFSGYLNADVSHVNSFSSDIAARVGADGQYLYAGRSSHVFTSGGVLIYPGEIEAVLLGLDAVIDCAVTGVADAALGLAILAVVVLRDEAEYDQAALATALASALPASRQPTHFYRAKTLPRDVWGSVRRDELVRQFFQKG